MVGPVHYVDVVADKLDLEWNMERPSQLRLSARGASAICVFLRTI